MNYATIPRADKPLSDHFATLNKIDLAKDRKIATWRVTAIVAIGYSIAVTILFLIFI